MEGQQTVTSWFYALGAERIGPISEPELVDKIRAGVITPATLVWREGMGDWIAASQSDLAPHFAAGGPPPLQPATPYQYQAASSAGQPAWPAESYRSLYTWYAILMGVGLLVSVTGWGALLGVPMLIAVIVLLAIQIYRFWSIIQDIRPKHTPGQAVGFCFIPLFNLYWGFEAIWGLAKEMNRYCRERSINVRPINEGLALVPCIIACCLIIPYIGFFLGLPAYIVLSIIVFKAFSETAVAITQARGK